MSHRLREPNSYKMVPIGTILQERVKIGAMCIFTIVSVE